MFSRALAASQGLSPVTGAAALRYPSREMTRSVGIISIANQTSYGRGMAFAPEGTFTKLERDRAARAGSSTSRAKVEAARRNGRNGGRPSTRTLLERILNRKVTQGEYLSFRHKVLRWILYDEQQRITDHFHADWMEIPTVSGRRTPLSVRQAIRHVKAAAKIYRWRPSARPKAPNEYVLIRVPKSEGERNAWERRHPDMPFVMTRPQKLPISSLPDYAWFDQKFAMGVDLDVDDILRNCEGKITRETAVAIVKHLKFKHAKP